MPTRREAMGYLDKAVLRSFMPGSDRADFIHQPRTHSPQMTKEDFRVLKANVVGALQDIKRALKAGSALESYMFKPRAE